MTRDNQKARSEATREAILDLALAMALEDGFESLSMRKICGALRCTTGVLYHHFRDKRAIIDAILRREEARLGRVIAEAVPKGADTAQKMRACFHAIMRVALDEPERYNLIVRSLLSPGEQKEPGLLPMLAAAIREGVARGELSAVDPERAAFSVWSSFLGFHLVLSMRSMTEAEAEAHFETQFQMIMKGIGA